MGLALALPVVASLAALATVEPEVGFRGEARTSTLAPSGVATETRGALLAVPLTGLRVDVAALRLEARYAPRIWTSDVVERPSPIVTHEAELRIGTHHDRPWRAEASARAARGWTDPLADPVRALARMEPAEAAALDPTPFESLRAGAAASTSFGPRTTVGATAGAWHSGGIDATDRLALPVQRGAAAELSLVRLASLRDTVRLRASATGTTTAAPTADVVAASTSAVLGWRRRLTPTLDGWVDAGAALRWEDRGDDPVRRGVLPVGETGVSYARGRATLEGAAQVAPYTDRLTGTLDPMLGARAALRYRASPRVSFASSASGGTLPDGDTALAALDARARYAVRERLALELGVVGRWQRERRGDLPSFAEGGVVLAIAWELASPAPAPAPVPVPAAASAVVVAAPLALRR